MIKLPLQSAASTAMIANTSLAPMGSCGSTFAFAPFMNVMGVCRYLRMVCRIVPALAQLTSSILAVKAILRHPQSSFHNLEALEHFQQATVTQCEPIAK
jgi:hypothetical protein